MFANCAMVVVAIAVVIIACYWSAGLYAPYDPHRDPVFMATSHDPMYCPKCREDREKH